jgi:hypothetical protein
MHVVVSFGLSTNGHLTTYFRVLTTRVCWDGLAPTLYLYLVGEIGI